MREFLEIFSSVSYIFFIVSAVTFGISLAVKTLVISTIKKVNTESNKNFDKIEDNNVKTACEKVLCKAESRYVKYCDNQAKRKKIFKKNKVRSFFRLPPYKELEKSDELKDVFLSLLKDVSIAVNGDGGYLNFSKNEFFSMVKTLLLRLKILIDSLDIIWLKTVKIPFIIQILRAYTDFEKFKGKTSVLITLSLLNFAFTISRIFSPVSATKNLANNIYSENFSKTLAKAIIEVVGKEWAYLCYEKQKLKYSQNK